MFTVHYLFQKWGLKLIIEKMYVDTYPVPFRFLHRNEAFSYLLDMTYTQHSTFPPKNYFTDPTDSTNVK